MFSQKKPPPDPSKIRLPKASIAPVIADLQAMHDQSKETGREVEQIWSEADSPKSYSMSTRFEGGAPSPTWTLWEDDGQEGRLVWKFETSDFELVNDVVCMLKKPKPAPGAGMASAPGEPEKPRDPFASVKPKPQHQAVDPFQRLGGNSGASTSQPQNPYQSNTRIPQQGDSSYQPGYFSSQPNQTQPAPAPAPPQTPQPTMRNPYLDSDNDPGFPTAAARPPARKEGDGVYAAAEKKSDTIEGNLTEMAVPALLQSLVSNQATGKLEILGEETVGDVYFENGVPKHAGTPTEYGDGAIKELVTWEKGTYVFTPNSRTDMRSVNQGLTEIIADGILLLDQKRHLKRAGLAYESYLVRLHKNLSDAELKLMLTKGAPLDFEFQRDIYHYLRHKRTFTDLLRDKPMDSSKWTALLFNFLSCGIIEIKQPDSIKGSALDF